MKKLLSLCIAILMVFCIAGCSSEGHEGQAKTPSGSGIQHGRDYQEVYEQFKENGFTNIQFEVLDDLITGWLTKDGEVESVSVDGDTDYSADEWYPADVEVIITYHTFPNKESGDNSKTTEPVTSDITELATDEPVTETTDAVTSSTEHIHDWKSENCTNPKTCSECGETEGTSLGHNYSDGKCTRCNENDPNYQNVEMVWIPTNGGTKYHRKSSCSKMKNPEEVTKSEAISRGFTPCGRCYQ